MKTLEPLRSAGGQAMREEVSQRIASLSKSGGPDTMSDVERALQALKAEAEWMIGQLAGYGQTPSRKTLDALKGADVALSQASPAREGWRLVPIEPTQEMLATGARSLENFYTKNGPYPRTRAMWDGMLSAAPSPAPESARDTSHHGDAALSSQKGTQD